MSKRLMASAAVGLSLIFMGCSRQDPTIKVDLALVECGGKFYKVRYSDPQTISAAEELTAEQVQAEQIQAFPANTGDATLLIKLDIQFVTPDSPPGQILAEFLRAQKYLQPPPAPQ